VNALDTIRHIMQRYIGKRPQQAKQLRYAEYIVQTMQARMRQAAGSSPSSITSYGSATSNSQADYGGANILDRIAAARNNTDSRASHDKWQIKP